MEMVNYKIDSLNINVINVNFMIENQKKTIRNLVKNYCGMMAIRAALEDRGETRKRVLISESAHGSNSATGTGCAWSHVDGADRKRK